MSGYSINGSATKKVVENSRFGLQILGPELHHAPRSLCGHLDSHSLRGPAAAELENGIRKRTIPNE